MLLSEDCSGVVFEVWKVCARESWHFCVLTNNSFRTFTCWNLFWWICEFSAAQNMTKTFFDEAASQCQLRCVFSRDSIQMKMVSKIEQVYHKRLKLLTHNNWTITVVDYLWSARHIMWFTCLCRTETCVREHNFSMLEGNMAYTCDYVLKCT